MIDVGVGVGITWVEVGEGKGGVFDGAMVAVAAGVTVNDVAGVSVLVWARAGK